MNEEKEVYFDQYCKSCKHNGLDAEKKDAIDIATELCYSEEVKKKLAQAKSVYEIGRILKQARLNQE